MQLALGKVERLLGTIIDLDEHSRTDDEAAWVSIERKGKAKRKAPAGGGESTEAPKGKGGAKDAA